MQRGDIALGGTEEYLPSHRFTAVDHDRWIIGRGESIVVFNPNAKGDTSKYQNTTVDQKISVPKGFEAEVMNGYARLTRSAEA